MAESYRVFATCDIGQEALQRLRDRAYELEVYDQVEPPSRALVLDRVGSGIDGLITTLRDQIEAQGWQVKDTPDGPVLEPTMD